MSDPVRHAYATLGLEPGASPKQMKRRYRELVKKWHPDRHASDPSGQTEAARQMAQITLAYRTLLETQGSYAHASVSSSTATTAPPREHWPGGRLTREQIDEMVSAIGSQGPIESFFASLERLWNRFGTVAIVLVLFVALPVTLVTEGPAGLRRRDPYLIQTGALVLASLAALAQKFSDRFKKRS
jgi:curved DNA-binding protein CbpA